MQFDRQSWEILAGEKEGKVFSIFLIIMEHIIYQQLLKELILQQLTTQH